MNLINELAAALQNSQRNDIYDPERPMTQRAYAEELLRLRKSGEWCGTDYRTHPDAHFLAKKMQRQLDQVEQTGKPLPGLMYRPNGGRAGGFDSIEL